MRLLVLILCAWSSSCAGYHPEIYTDIEYYDREFGGPGIKADSYTGPSYQVGVRWVRTPTDGASAARIEGMERANAELRERAARAEIDAARRETEAKSHALEDKRDLEDKVDDAEAGLWATAERAWSSFLAAEFNTAKVVGLGLLVVCVLGVLGLRRRRRKNGA